MTQNSLNFGTPYVNYCSPPFKTKISYQLTITLYRLWNSIGAKPFVNYGNLSRIRGDVCYRGLAPERSAVSSIQYIGWIWWYWRCSFCGSLFVPLKERIQNQCKESGFEIDLNSEYVIQAFHRYDLTGLKPSGRCRAAISQRLQADPNVWWSDLSERCMTRPKGVSVTVGILLQKAGSDLLCRDELSWKADPLSNPLVDLQKLLKWLISHCSRFSNDLFISVLIFKFLMILLSFFPFAVRSVL